MNRKVIYSLVAVAFLFFVTSLIVFLGSQREPETGTQAAPVEAQAEQALPPDRISVKAFYFSERSPVMQPVALELANSAVRADLYRQFVDLLIQEQDNHLAPVPPGLRLRTLYYVETRKMLVLDFNDKLITQFPGGTTAELEFIYFIVDNICFNFDEVKMVKFLVAGNEYSTLGGHIDFENPFYPDFRYLRVD